MFWPMSNAPQQIYMLLPQPLSSQHPLQMIGLSFGSAPVNSSWVCATSITDDWTVRGSGNAACDISIRMRSLTRSTYPAIKPTSSSFLFACCVLPDDAKDKTQKKNKTRGTTINIYFLAPIPFFLQHPPNKASIDWLATASKDLPPDSAAYVCTNALRH